MRVLLVALLLSTAGLVMAQTTASRQLVVSAARFTGNHLDQDVTWGSPRDSREFEIAVGRYLLHQLTAPAAPAVLLLACSALRPCRRDLPPLLQSLVQ